MFRGMPRLATFLVLLAFLLLAYDFARPLLPQYDIVKKSDKTTDEIEQVTELEGSYTPTTVEQNVELSASLAHALNRQLENGKWALVLYLPAPQKQGREHDDLLKSIVNRDGALQPLRRDNVTRYQYTHNIDTTPEPWVFYLHEAYKHAGQGYGTLQLYDCRGSKPRLVYSQRFPYTGMVDEFPKSWVTSQVISRELAVTVQRWNLQTSHLDFKQGG